MDGGDAGSMTDGGTPPADSPVDLCDAVDCSSLDDECNVGICDPSDGSCDAMPLSDGTACDDGDACTSGDTCGAGACGGSAVDCSGSDDMCNVGVCNPTDGSCDAMPVADGTVCDDGDACTTLDVCGAGTCGGAAVDCTGLSDMCNVGMCDSTTGTCAAVPVADGATCDDGNACTTGDSCGGGLCAGAVVDCSGVSDQCNAGMCNPTTGACDRVPVTDGITCDDGAACTTTDVCTAGACAGAAVDCSGSADQCNSAACNPTTGACDLMPVADGTTCSDGNACNTGEVCSAGTCGGGAAVDCSGSANACNTAACNPTTGACDLTPRADGTSCADGNSCTTADVCTAGMCAGTAGDNPRFDFESGVTHEWTMTGGTAGWITLAGEGRSGGTAFANADIANSQAAHVQLDVVYAAAGTVSFWRRTSTESGFDFLRFYIDGVEQASWSGTNAYAQFTYPVAAGAHTFEWRYTKDGSVSAGTDTVYVDDVQLTGGVTRATFERGLPATFTTPTGVTAGWTARNMAGDAATGTFAMVNADIGNSQSAGVETTVRVPNAGTVSFARRVSSEGSFDFLRFYVDGVELGSWSGTVAYSRVSFPITAGTHTLAWRYTKDGSVSSGTDSAYVDDIEIAVDACAVSTTFPTAGATVSNGTPTTLGAIGGTRYYQTGNYLEEAVTFAGRSSIGALRLQFQMNDQTAGCAVGATHTFDVIVNGTTVGTYSFTTPATRAGTISIDRSYTFAAIAGTGAGSSTYTIRLQATSTVCSGGDSWMWIAGGTATGT